MKKKITQILKRASLFVLLCTITEFTIIAQYTLTDNDVVVTNGIIQSCNYNFAITNIVIPETLDGQTITGIGNNVFNGKGITNVTLPGTLISIGTTAFYNNALSGISLLSCTKLAYIGSNAFASNSGLTYFSMPPTHYAGFEYWQNAEGTHYSAFAIINNFSTYYFINLPYVLNDDDVVVNNGIIESCSYNFEFRVITIPETLDGQRITGIADKNSDNGVFMGKEIAKIILPGTLVHIGSYAFKNNLLYNLDLSNLSVLKTLGRNAFENGGIKTINFSGCTALETIGSYAFDINGISAIVLSECSALKTIGSCAFINNSALRSVNLSNCVSLETIDYRSFYNNGISTLYINGCSALTTIGIDAFSWNNININVDFSGCTALETIGNSAFFDNGINVLNLSPCTFLKTIGSKAFSMNSSSSLNLTGCTALTSIGEDAFYHNQFVQGGVNLSNCISLTYIGAGAFRNFEVDANRLTSITLPTPNITGYQLNNWEDTDGNEYAAGTVVSNFLTSYSANLTAILYNVNFSITDGANPIEGAIITIDGSDYLTDATGKATATDIITGTYDYTVSATGYLDKSGTVTILGANIEESVNLQPVYNITFNVTDVTSPIEGATITINGTNYTTDANGKAVIENLETDTYEYTVVATGYEGTSGSVTVSNTDETVQVNMEKMFYAVNFNITYGTTPIEGAIIIINGTNYGTDATGKVVIENLEADTYEYTVLATGYEVISGSVTITDADETIQVSMTKLVYYVTFYITDGSNPIDVATVTFNNSVYTIYANSTTAGIGINAESGTYNYTVEAEGFETVTGTIIIGNSNVTVEVVMGKTLGFESISKSSIKVYPNPSTSIVNVELEDKISFISILNMAGETIYLQDNLSSGDKMQIDVSSYPKGMYMMKIGTSNKIGLQKLIVE